MKYDLVGIDGNAFYIMGYVAQAMQECGRSRVEIDAYFQSAKSADYDHLLAVSVEMIDILNQEVHF